MKKIIVAGALALGLVALVQEPASAWVNSKFGVGLNWNMQAGGNSLFWGLCRNGQPPGPEAYGAPGQGPGYYGAPFGFGDGQPAFQSPAPQVAPPGVAPPPVTPPAGNTFNAPYIDPAIINSMSQPLPFQFANYPRQAQYFYTPNYYTPNYYTPNTWYGNR